MSTIDIFYKKEMIMESIEFDSYLPIREGFGSTVKNIFTNIINAIRKFFESLIDKVKNIFRREGSSNNTKIASVEEDDKEKAEEAKKAEEESRKKAEEAKKAEEKAKKEYDTERKKNAIKKAKDLKQRAEENKQKAEKLRQEAEELRRKATRKAEEVKFNRLPKEKLSKPLKANEVQERFKLYNDHIRIHFKYYCLSIDKMMSKFIKMTSENFTSFCSEVSLYDSKQFESHITTKLGVEKLDDYFDSISFSDTSKEIKNLTDIDSSICADYYNRGDQILEILRKSSKQCTEKLKKAEKEYEQYMNENNKEEGMKNTLENTKFICWAIKVATLEGVQEFKSYYDRTIQILKICYIV